MQLTMVAQTATVAAHQTRLPNGYSFRPMHKRDISELAALFFAVHPRSVVEAMALAVEEMKMTFAGDFGELLTDLSPVVIRQEKIVSAIMTVHNAPRENTPRGLFIIEVFTHPDYRRQGLAKAGLTQMAAEAQTRGYETVSLCVESENRGAMALYQSLCFTE